MINTIMKAIDYSALAYQNPADIESQVDGFKWIENKDTDTQAFICEDDDNTWVSFRGTEFNNLGDWLTNLDCSFKHGPFGKCHRGFYSDALSILWELDEQLIDNIMSEKPIIFTGHSQGAAVATQYFTIRCKQFPGVGDRCIPIEPPRSMSKKAAETFGDAHGSKMYHVINNNDIVCLVPTRLMGYAHVTCVNLNYLDEDGDLHHNISWWEKFRDRIKGRLCDFGELGTDGVKDHSITGIQRIWRDLK